MDVTSVEQIRAGVAQAAEALGGLDLLVNNAGVERSAPALEVEEETWDLILDTNLKGAFFTAQAAARIMPQGRGLGDPQHLLADLGAWHPDGRALRLVEVGPARHDPGAGRRMGPLRHPGQRARARATSTPT